MKNIKVRATASDTEEMTGVPHIVILGGGYVGMYTALGLQKRFGRRRAQITVVDPRTYMTYQPFLAEVAAGSLEPRHVVVPLRKILNGCEVVTGHVRSISHRTRTIHIDPDAGDEYTMSYDVLVVALGSISRTLAIPGLADVGIGFKQVEEAIGLRNHVLDRLDVAASTSDDTVRKRALTFVFVGGGFAGVEALAELEDMAQYARSHYYPQISPKEIRWLMIEGAGRILPEVGDDMGRYTVRELSKRGIEIKLETFLESCEDGHIVLSKGPSFEADTVVWTAGVMANTVIRDSDLPLDSSGRVRCDATMRVVDNEGVVDGVWAAGDNAAVPDSTSPTADATYAPNAQNAVREAKQLAKNIVAFLHGREPEPYVHRYVGSVASLGLYRGVAHVYGIKIKGFPAWFMHRTYHMSKMPTFNRKVRIILDWSTALFFGREVVSLGRTSMPREEFQRAAALPTRVRSNRSGTTTNRVQRDKDGRADFERR